MLPRYYCCNSFRDRAFFLLTAISMPSLLFLCLPGMTTTFSLHLIFFLSTLFACLNCGLPSEWFLLLTEPDSSSLAFASEAFLCKSTYYPELCVVSSTCWQWKLQILIWKPEKGFCALSYNLTVLGNSVGHWLECFTGLIDLACLPN